MNEYIRVAEMAKRLDINPNTLRRWLLQYEEFLNIRKERKMKYIHEDSIETLQLIKQYYDEFRKEHEIMQLLSANTDVIRTVNSDEVDDEQVNESAENAGITQVPADIGGLQSELAEIKELLLKQGQQMKIQAEFNQQLMQQLNNQQDYIQRLLEDKTKEEEKEVKQLDTPQEKEGVAKKKSGFFSRLFGKSSGRD